MRIAFLLLTPLAFLFQRPEIEVRDVQTTPTQAVLVFDVPDPSSCSVKIASNEALTAIVHDTNDALFPGSLDCGRPGSFKEDSRVTFVAGVRRAEKAADGRFYSRALETNRTYFYEIRSGGKVKLGSFQTRTIPLGKLYGEPYPFDRSAPGNYAWPSVNWSSLDTEYVDPLTGVVMKRITGPQMVYPEITKPAPGLASFDTGKGSWTNAASAAALDNRTATFSGSGKDALFIRAPLQCPSGYLCDRTVAWDTPYESLDDVQVSVLARCGSAGCTRNENGERDAEICLTTNGVTCTTAWKSITVPISGNDPVLFPSKFPSSLTAAWLGGEFRSPVARPDTATFTGTVAANGKEVRLVKGDSFSPLWIAGSHIQIGGNEYLIEQVQGAKLLTLQADAGQQPNATYTANNFGLLIRKKNPGADLLEVDGANFSFAYSHEFEVTPSGSRDFCAETKVTDVSGKEGFLCTSRTPGGYPGIFFISPSDGDSRFLGIVQAPYNADVRGGAIDGNQGDCLRGLAINTRHPNQVYCVMESNANQGLLVFRGTYHPEGNPGCNQPAGYQAIPAGTSCHFTWEHMTKASAGQTLLKRAQAFDRSFDPARYPFTALFSVQGGAIGFLAWSSQDTMAWSIWLDADSFDVISMQNYHSNAPCRFCAVHALQQMGDGEYNTVVVKDFVGGGSTNAGPYDAKVTAVAGSGDTSLNAQNFQSCPTDIDPKFQELGATGVRCITLTLAGDPCDPDPSEWEKANMPACTWQAGLTSLQPIQVGDEANSGTERFLFVKKLPGNQWVLMRNFALRHGPTMRETSSRVASHPPGFRLRMACSAAMGSGYVWVKFREDAHGTAMLRDLALSRAEHGDVSAIGNIIVGYDGTSDQFGRFIWKNSVPGRVGQPADLLLFSGTTFGGISVTNSPVFRAYIQTHPSWRQSLASEDERKWYLDGNPFAPGAGGVYTLWPQNATPVSGTLYKLANLPSPLARKVLPTIGWAGRYLMEDISGPGAKITGDPADQYKYCVADFEGECRDGSSPGDVFLNAPSFTNDGQCGGSFGYHRPCFTSMVNTGIGINQYGIDRNYGPNADRYLTGHLQRYNGTWTYSNAVPLPDGSWAVTSGSWLEGARNDLLLIKIPPYPEPDSVDRGTFVPVSVEVPRLEGASKVRLRFGYAENGQVDRYYCTSRREACTTGGSPYAWAGEAQLLEECANGCTLTIPAISGRVVYYTADWLDDSRNVIRSGSRGAVAVP